MDRFDGRLGEELHREFDVQAVDTPPPHRARYGRLAERPGRRPMRAVALVTAAFAVGILVGLAYEGGRIIPPGPGRQVGVIPDTPTAHATSEPSPPAAAGPRTPGASPRPASPRQPGATATAPAAPAFADDFEADPVGADPPAGWRVDDGQWAGVVADGSHVVRHSAAQPLGHLSAGSARWADYSVSADVGTDLLALGYAGVAGRYKGPGDGYECTVGVGAQLELSVVRGGERRSLAVSGVALDLSGEHTIRLEMRGSRLTCSLDGTPLRATDTTFASGRIALVASAGEGAEFDNVRVSG